MWNFDVLALVFTTFFIAGLIKGVVGFGLPVVILAFLVPTLGLKTAIALVVVPAVIANVWQATVGGHFREILRRIWPMLLLSCVFIWIGVGFLASADARMAAGELGVLLSAYAIYSLTRTQLAPPRGWEVWLTPLVGALSGLAYGYTGSLMIPGVVYLQALGFNRNMLVQSLGITFFTMTSVLGLSLTGHSLMPAETALLSAAALVPTGIGMLVGQRYRDRVSEELFRKLFFWALFVAGVYMVLRAVF